jgi:hypothetical protein
MAFDVLVTEDMVDWAANGWVKNGDHDIVTYPLLADYIYSDFPAGELNMTGSSLFVWLDGGPATRSAWIEKTFTGLPPLTVLGVRAYLTWILRLNGFLFMRLTGDDVTFVTLTDIAYNFWSVPAGLAGLKARENIAYARTNAAGELKVEIGLLGYFATNNNQALFEEFEILEFQPSVAGGYLMSPKDRVAP